MKLALVLALAAVGCAKGGLPQDRGGGGGGDDEPAKPDAGIDAPEQRGDAPPIDAAEPQPDAPALPIDAPPCVPTQGQLLLNGNFDSSPEGVNWVGAPIDSSYPIITADSGGMSPHTGTRRAWLGGYEDGGDDSLYQDFAVPATTTAITLTGYYAVITGESGSSVYDSATLALTTTGNTVLQAIGTYDNAHPASAWTAVNYTFTNVPSLAGTTVRLRFASHEDNSYATSFFFDTISITATFCQ